MINVPNQTEVIHISSSFHNGHNVVGVVSQQCLQTIFIMQSKRVTFKVHYCGLETLPTTFKKQNKTWEHNVFREQKHCPFKKCKQVGIHNHPLSDVEHLQLTFVALGSKKKKKVNARKSLPLSCCGYFCTFPGVRHCPRNGWGLKNVAGVTDYVAACCSGSIHKTVWFFFFFTTNIFWPMNGLKTIT